MSLNKENLWIFHGDFYQTFKVGLITILLSFCQNITEKRSLSNSFYETRITLVPKANSRKRKLYTNILKNPSANAGDIRDLCSISGSGRSPRGDHGNPLQFSCLENPIDRGAW